MSGICGVVAKRRNGSAAGSVASEAALLERMAAVLGHRGPDDAGFLLIGGPEGRRRLETTGSIDLGGSVHGTKPRDGAVWSLVIGGGAAQKLDAGLGVRRLAVSDPVGGHQPIGNEEGTVWIVLDGGIGNAPELRRELKGRGHRFSTASEAEVVVHAYEEFGVGGLSRLRGQFALTLWDDRVRALLLARDPSGLRPLFVAETPERFLFASEIKALLQDASLPRGVNNAALRALLTEGAVPAPETLFRGVYELPPGCVLQWRDGKVTATPGAACGRDRTPLVPAAPAPALDADEAWGVICGTVEAYLSSDLEGLTAGCGVFLDGGLASVALVAAMRERFGAGVPTFAAGGERKLAEARAVAWELGTAHAEVRLEPEAEGLWPRLLWHLEQPLAGPEALGRFLAARAAREHVTVVLSPETAPAEERAACCDVVGTPVTDAGRRTSAARCRAQCGVRGRDGACRLAWKLVPALTAYAARRALHAPRAPKAPGHTLPLLTDREGLEIPADDPLLVALVTAIDGCGSSGIGEVRVVFSASDPRSGMDRLAMAFGLEGRAPFYDDVLQKYAAGIAPEVRLLQRVTGDARLLTVFHRALAGRVPARLLRDALRDELRSPAHTHFALPASCLGDGSILRRRQAEGARPGELGAAFAAALAPEAVRARGLVTPEAVERLARRARWGDGGAARQLWSLFLVEVWHRAFIDREPSPRGDLTFADLDLGRPEKSVRRWACGGAPALPAAPPNAPLPLSAPIAIRGQRGLSVLMLTTEEPTAPPLGWSGRGTARLLREWSFRLAARGHAVTILTCPEASSGGSPATEFEFLEGVEIVRRPVGGRTGAPLSVGQEYRQVRAICREAAREVERLGREKTFDAVIAHHPAFGAALRRSALCRGAARLYVFRLPWAQEEDDGAPSRILSLLRHHLEGAAIASCDGVIVPSRWSAAQLAACHGESARALLLPGGVDTRRFRPRTERRELRRRLGLCETAFLLLTVRPLVPRMGLENLLTAFAGVRQAFPEAHLVIGGEGPLWGALRKQAVQQRLGNSVTFAGFIPEELLPDYYAMADLFVIPSRYGEAFGLAAVESLACGTPVFATPVGGLPELLAHLDPRALFAGTGAGDIADGIIRHLPDLHHDDVLRRRCRQFVLEHYDWEVLTPVLEDLLLDAVARRRHADGRPAVPPRRIEGLAPHWPCFE